MREANVTTHPLGVRKEFEVIMYRRSGVCNLCFNLIFLLLGNFVLAQMSSPQGVVSPVRTAPSSTPIAVGENGVKTYVLSAPGAGGGDQTDAVPDPNGDEINRRIATAPSSTIDTGVPSFEILIGPGDLIEVSVYGAADYVKEVRVRSTGEITLPMAGTVKVSGLTPAQAEALIAKRLIDGDFFNDPRVSVIEKETVTQGISILGEVQKPGVYPLPGPRKLFDAISAAGGTTPRAGNTVSIMHRSNSLTSEILPLSYGKSSSQSNVYVYPGDTVVVSKAGVVYVVGDVHLPGGFVMENSHMTLLQAYAMAQGANPTAALDKAKLIRKSGSGDQVVSLKKILAAKAPDMNLQADDIIFIPTSGAKVAGKRTVDAIVQTATGIAIYSRVP